MRFGGVKQRGRKRKIVVVKDGEHRRRSAFLWFPKTINGETRWLERAKWVEVYRDGMDLSPGLPALNPGESIPKVTDWFPERWVNPHRPAKNPRGARRDKAGQGVLL